MKSINSSSSKADEGNGHARARTTRAADPALGRTFLFKKKDREKRKEEIEKGGGEGQEGGGRVKKRTKKGKEDRKKQNRKWRKWKKASVGGWWGLRKASLCSF